MLQSFIWANGSDGLPLDPIRTEYRTKFYLGAALAKCGCRYRVIVSRRIDKGERIWDGIIMEGPYSWRPPNVLVSPANTLRRADLSAEQGDNEHIPTLESLKKFIPGRQALADQRHVVPPCWSRTAGMRHAWEYSAGSRSRRYGPSDNVEDFVRKAQLAHYENTRAQFEDFAATDWANHKMTMYWMLNSHWPSLYGNIIDYYLKPGGFLLRREKGPAPAVGGL
jgi:exo-1,4-beta-D-glucosaminidase